MSKLEIFSRTQTLVDRVDKLRDLFLEERQTVQQVSTRSSE